MITKVMKTVFGTRNDRELKRMGKVVKQINALADDIKALSDEQLAAKTAEFAAVSETWPLVIERILASLGIKRLYRHQDGVEIAYS